MKRLTPGCVALCACVGGDASNVATVRDSAGIRIVESARSAARHFAVSQQPTLSIGTVDDDPDQQLYQVTGVLQRSDGVLVVANSGTHELRFYESDGRFIRGVGHEGDGPGEFRQLASPAWGRDSLIVYDWNLRRVSIFDSAGTFARSVRIDLPGGTFPGTVMPFGDDALIVRAGGTYGPSAEPGVRRDSTSLFLLGWDGSVLDSVIRFPDTERLVIRTERMMTVTSRIFGLGTSMALHGDRIYLGDNASFEIRVLNRTGLVERMVRRAHTPVPVTPSDIEANRTRRLARAEEQFRAMIESQLGEMTYPETYPAFSGIQVDTEGLLWVLDYPTQPDAPRQWSVFDHEGSWVGVATTPAELTVQAIGRDWIVGIARDDLGVEYVRRYALARGLTP